MQESSVHYLKWYASIRMLLTRCWFIFFIFSSVNGLNRINVASCLLNSYYSVSFKIHEEKNDTLLNFVRILHQINNRDFNNFNCIPIELILLNRMNLKRLKPDSGLSTIFNAAIVTALLSSVNKHFQHIIFTNTSSIMYVLRNWTCNFIHWMENFARSPTLKKKFSLKSKQLNAYWFDKEFVQGPSEENPS